MLRSSVPSWALLCSYVLQAVLLMEFIALWPELSSASQAHLRTAEQVLADHEISYVPDQQSPSIADPESAGAAAKLAPAKREPAHAAGKPVTAMYRGPQELVSRSEEPVNHLQTIQRSDLVRPPKLKLPLALPNLVSIAAVPLLAPVIKPVDPTPQPAPPVAVRILPNAEQPVAKPALPLMPSPPPSMASAAPAAMPVLQPHESGKDDKDALVLNALNLQRSQSAGVPNAILAGSFSVSPTAVIDPSSRGGIGGGSSTGSGIGTGSGAATGTTAGTGAANATGAGTGPANATGTGSANATGHGNGNGAGTGNGTGTVNVYSGGAGGTGRKAFTGIAITGGKGGSGGSSSVSRNAGPAYGLTIRAGGSSGGALRNYGTFRETDTVYTVYINMADAGGGVEWPLQYTILDVNSLSADQRQLMLSPPTAVQKHSPDFPPELAARFSGTQVIIQAVLTQDGKFRDVKVIESPHETLKEPVLKALASWEFVPAKLGKTPANLRVLMGVPVHR